MDIQQVEKDMYVLVGETYQSDSLLLTKGDDALLIGAMASRQDAERLRRFVECDLKKQARFIICTHFFSDHLAALKLFPQSQIVAHKHYKHTFDSELHRSEEEVANFVEPTMLISEEMTMRWGSYTLDIFHNPAHTMSTLCIDIPDADLLVVGDTLVGNMVYFSYTTPEMFYPALKRLQRRGRTRLLSSHLGLRRGDAINYGLHYLTVLQEKVEVARRACDEDSIMNIHLDDCLPPGASISSYERIFHERNLRSIVERKLFATR
jgi:cyclase